MSPETTEARSSRIWIPCSVTAACIGLGFGSILAAAEGRYDLAIYLLYFAVILDLVDGRVARWLGATSRFGQELDSFSDAISFGVAPAFLVYRVRLEELGAVGVLLALTYLLAGVLRLARFNLTEDAHGKSSRTVGVPIPVGAGYLMAVALMRDRLSPSVAAVVVLLLTLGMISRWALPNPKGKGLLAFMVLVGIANYTAVLLRPNWWTVAWWNVWNVLILIAARSQSEADESPVQLQPGHS